MPFSTLVPVYQNIGQLYAFITSIKHLTMRVAFKQE